jgi:predicted Zn-dependent peptidase
MLAVEADRMANQGAAITEADLELERGIVLNEMRENVLDHATGAGWEAIRTALFPPGHPYSRAVIGSMADLAEAKIEDVHRFFDLHYAPNNAILVLAGDFDTADAMAMIAETFGQIPRGPDLPRSGSLAVEPTRLRLDFEDRCPTPVIVLGWTVPPFGTPELGAIRVAGELLGDPDTGLLKNKLLDAGLAATAHAWHEPGMLASRFFIYATAANGTDPAKVEEGARAALAVLTAAATDPANVLRAQRRLLLADRVAAEPLAALAGQVAVAANLLDRPAAALDDDPGVAAATTQTVGAAVAALLDPRNATVMLIHSGDRSDTPEVLTRSSGPAPTLTAAPRRPIRIPHLAARRAGKAAPPQSDAVTLGNGLRLVHFPMDHAPVTYLAAVATAGALSAPEGREGIVELATMMATRGAGGRSREAFGKALRDLGATMTWQVEDSASALAVTSPGGVLGEAAGLLADAVRYPDFPVQDWRVAVAETLDELAWREGDLLEVAERTAEQVLYPKIVGLAAVDRSIESVGSITRNEAMALHPRLFNPSSTTLYSIGSAPLGEIVEAVEASFGDWSSAIAPLPRVLLGPATFPTKPRVLLAPEPGTSQTALHVVRPAAGMDEPQRAAAVATYRLLADDFLSRLNAVIREAKGLSYGTGGDLLDVRRGGAISVSTAVAQENTGEALADIMAGFSSLATEPVRREELERTISAFRTGLAGIGETAAGLFEDILAQLGAGTTLEASYARRLATTRLTLAALRREAAALAPLNEAVIVVVGDPSVHPQLEQMGFDIELVTRPARGATPPAAPPSPPGPPSGSI